MLRESDHDSLTGLLTHHSFRNYLDEQLSHEKLAPSDDCRYAILYFNIENFKHYNQRYGFAAGDTLIKHVADSITRAFPHRIAARFSADQFVVITREDVIVEGTKAVRRDFRKEHKDSSIWLRAGYYVIQQNDRDAGVVCDRAKMACDELRGRRDTYLREYDKDLQHHIIWRRYVLDHFDEALENHWIQAWCQPIVRVATGETCDCEALARWIDPTEGVVPPFEFVPVLEEARVIHRMDLAIIRDVCSTCQQLAQEGRPYLPVSFNLSRLDFELCDIVAEVMDVLEEYDIPHNMVSMEVTESALTGNAEFLKGEIDRFRAAGIEVWMDDFGSGYSSLNVLKDYTFDMVKVDMAFLRGLQHTEQARIMLAKVIDMAKELGIKTLVEGVETQDQYDFLCSLGCGRAQGWLFGKPTSQPASVEGITNDTHPEVEPVDKRAFYEEIGRINLMRPDPHPTAEGHYLPSDTPCCIIRRCDGNYEYLNSSDLYEQFLNSIGHVSLRESERIINNPAHPLHARFASLASRCIESNDWAYNKIETDGKTIVVRMRPISSVPGCDEMALLAIVDEVLDVDAEVRVIK